MIDITQLKAVIAKQNDLLETLSTVQLEYCHPELLQYIRSHATTTRHMVEIAIAEPVADNVTIENLTTDYVQRYWAQTNRFEAVARHCGMCNAPMTYRSILGELCIDTNCHCTNYITQPKHVGWGRLVEAIRSSNIKERQIEIAKNLGINLV